MSERMSGRSQEQALMGRLQQAPVLQRLAGRYLQVLRKIARPRTFKNDEVVIEAQCADPGLFILIKGTWSVGDGQVQHPPLEPITTAGELAMLTETPQQQVIRSVGDSIALHIPQQILAALFARDADLYQRLCRNGINDLSSRLIQTNAEMTRLSQECTQLETDLAAAEIELNDARLLQSMRG